jgi:hypothetical protein
MLNKGSNLFLAELVGCQFNVHLFEHTSYLSLKKKKEKKKHTSYTDNWYLTTQLPLESRNIYRTITAVPDNLKFWYQ